MKKPLKAYEDLAFLRQDVCRPIRLQLEFLKPEVHMQRNHIHSTIVLYGSARLLSPEKARAKRRLARRELAETPGSRAKKLALQQADTAVELSRFYQVARDFAALVSRCTQTEKECHYVIMTGGGGGIMEAGNRGAADVGAKSIGLNISLPFEQKPNPYITPDLVFDFHYFSLRKMHFMLRAKALCAFPGGFGTLDEMFETLTLIQTRKIKPIPVILFGRKFWNRLINWKELVRLQLIRPEDLNIFHYAETAEEAWDYIRNFWQNGNPNPPST